MKNDHLGVGECGLWVFWLVIAIAIVMALLLAIHIITT